MLLAAGLDSVGSGILRFESIQHKVDVSSGSQPADYTEYLQFSGH